MQRILLTVFWPNQKGNIVAAGTDNVMLCSKAHSRRFGGLVRRAVQDDATKASQGLQQLAPDCTINLSHFQDLLREIDNTLRALPATGQVHSTNNSTA